MAAPHGSSDARTAEIAAEVARRTGFGLVVASGFELERDTRERPGRRYQVNRPFEGTPSRPPSEDTSSLGARRVYEAYERRVREIAQGPLRFYAEIHGNNRRESARRIGPPPGRGPGSRSDCAALADLVRDATCRQTRVPRLDVVSAGDPVFYAAPAPSVTGPEIAERASTSSSNSPCRARPAVHAICATSFAQEFSALAADCSRLHGRADRRLDRVLSRLGIPGPRDENAGRGAAHLLLRRSRAAASARGLRVAVCRQGRHGAMVFVRARFLQRAGARRSILWGLPPRLYRDAALNTARCGARRRRRRRDRHPPSSRRGQTTYRRALLGPARAAHHGALAGLIDAINAIGARCRPTSLRPRRTASAHRPCAAWLTPTFARSRGPRHWPRRRARRARRVVDIGAPREVRARSRRPAERATRPVFRGGRARPQGSTTSVVVAGSVGRPAPPRLCRAAIAPARARDVATSPARSPSSRRLLEAMSVHARDGSPNRPSRATTRSPTRRRLRAVAVRPASESTGDARVARALTTVPRPGLRC